MSTNTSVANKWTRHYPLIVFFLAIALVLSYLVIAPAPTVSRSVAHVPSNTANFQRGMEAYAARYQAMAEAYAAKEASITISAQRSRAAEIARLNGMAAAYTAQHSSSYNIQQGWKACAARYQGLANQYAIKETANLQRGWDAYAARYAAMAEREAKRLANIASP